MVVSQNGVSGLCAITLVGDLWLTGQELVPTPPPLWTGSHALEPQYKRRWNVLDLVQVGRI